MFLMPGSRSRPRALLPVSRGGNVANLRTDFDVSFMRDYLTGLILSNDSTSPNTVVDISAGVCADSSNSILIRLGAITKSTGGSWIPGNGNAAMGKGLTIANSTWYHVFAIINGGYPDVYFDTSVTASNAPGGTQFFRRLGSFLTNASANILTFTQSGDEFLWKTPAQDASALAISQTASSVTLTVPLGVRVNALMSSQYNAPAGTAAAFGMYALDQGTQTAAVGGGQQFILAIAGGSNSAQLTMRTNTSSQIGVVATSSGSAVYINTYGWIDRRGRDT